MTPPVGALPSLQLLSCFADRSGVRNLVETGLAQEVQLLPDQLCETLVEHPQMKPCIRGSGTCY